jgi:flagellar hook protein FlgE
MLRSLYSGVTGMQQHQKSMDVVGNNIANVNTIGYKASRAVFEDLMSQTLSVATAPGDGYGGVNPKQIGLGTKLGAIDINFNQGTPQQTGVNTDLAIQGDGFFAVKNAGSEQTFYTRAGNFTFDSNGYLVNPNGMIVQGWMRDLTTDTLTSNGEPGDIRIDQAYQVISPKQTTEVKLAGNLSTDAQASILEYQTLLTTLNSANNDLDMDLNKTFGYKGEKMDLYNGETIRIKAYANENTMIDYLHNESDQNLGLVAGSTINVSYGLNLSAQTTITVAAGSTLNDVINNINASLSAVGLNLTVTSNGTLAISNSGANPTKVSFAGDTRFISYLNEVGGTYNAGDSKRANSKLVAESQLIYGEDITSINDMIEEINRVIKNNVSAGFNAAYDDNLGSIVYSNSSVGSETISGFQIEKSSSSGAFEKTFDTFDTMTANSPDKYSHNIFRYAIETDPLSKLYTSYGDSLDINSGSTTIEVSAIVGGSNTGSVPIVTGDMTVEQLMIAIENAVLDQKDPDSTKLDGFVNINSGVITVRGEKGAHNKIDNILIKDISATNNRFDNYMRFNVLQEASGGQLITSQSIFDSQGNEHMVNYQFDVYDEANNVWKLKITPVSDEENIVITDALSQQVLGEEVFVQFNPDGSFNRFMTANGVRVDPVFTLEHIGGAYDISDVKIDLGTSDNFDGLTLSSRPNTITQMVQDGYKQGSLEDVSIDKNGKILGTYDNGKIISIGIIGIAKFSNNEGLLKMGESVFAETVNSGNAVIGEAGLGGRGVIESGALENSNVDLAQEFVTMITTQRGYQANSRIITTSDEMLQELLNLKR